MKIKFYLIPIFLLLIIPNIYSLGKVYTIGFNENIDKQILTIGLKDRVDFDLVDGSHTIIISGIKPEKQIQLDVYRYINLDIKERTENYPIGYVTIHPGEQAKLDLNIDKYNDLSIRVINIKENETTLLFTALHECIFSDPKLCEKQQENKEEIPITSFFILDFIKRINIIGIIVTLSIIILGIIIFFIYKKEAKS